MDYEEEHKKYSLARNKETWEEGFDKKFKVINNYIYYNPVYPKDVKAFIHQTRQDIAKEIIESIPDNMMNGYPAPGLQFGPTFKQSLRDKYLHN